MLLPDELLRASAVQVEVSVPEQCSDEGVSEHPSYQTPEPEMNARYQ